MGNDATVKFGALPRTRTGKLSRKILNLLGLPISPVRRKDGAPSQIRTDTVEILSLLPTTNWAIGA